MSHPDLAPNNSLLLPYVAAWEKHLAPHPDSTFVAYVLDGIENGFRVGFDYSHHLEPARRNMP